MYNTNYVNINGIAALESTGVSVSTDSVKYTMRPSFSSNVPYKGIILVKLSQSIPEGTTTTLPIVLSMNGFDQNLTVYGGDNLTVADFAGTGVYLVYYNRVTGELQLLMSV